MTIIAKKTFKSTDYCGLTQKLTVYEVITTSTKVKGCVFYNLSDAIAYCKKNRLKYYRPNLYSKVPKAKIA